MKPEGAVALVSGGASGLGRATAEALRERGAEVIVADLESAREHVDTGRFTFAAADVRDAEAVASA
ncbi:MAG: SDR family NAD(P)-dependent oxidoreductase, partial [Solirubrobacteraceae bacterium]